MRADPTARVELQTDGGDMVNESSVVRVSFRENGMHGHDESTPASGGTPTNEDLFRAAKAGAQATDTTGGEGDDDVADAPPEEEEEEEGGTEERPRSGGEAARSKARRKLDATQVKRR